MEEQEEEDKQGTSYMGGSSGLWPIHLCSSLLAGLCTGFLRANGVPLSLLAGVIGK